MLEPVEIPTWRLSPSSNKKMINTFSYRHAERISISMEALAANAVLEQNGALNISRKSSLRTLIVL